MGDVKMKTDGRSSVLRRRRRWEGSQPATERYRSNGGCLNLFPYPRRITDQNNSSTPILLCVRVLAPGERLWPEEVGFMCVCMSHVQKMG